MVWIKIEKMSNYVDAAFWLFFCAGSDENALLTNALEEHRVRLELVSVIMEGSEKTGP